MAEGHASHMKSASLLEGETSGKHIKIVMLGAGSAFTQRLVTDVLNVAAIPGGEIALVDIDTERLELADQVIRKVIQVMGKEKTWSVTATADRRKVLPGADYIINCIEVSRQGCPPDYEIAEVRVDQCIGDTTGRAV